jgi:hypothetical protein
VPQHGELRVAAAQACAARARKQGRRARTRGVDICFSTQSFPASLCNCVWVLAPFGSFRGTLPYLKQYPNRVRRVR